MLCTHEDFWSAQTHNVPTHTFCMSNHLRIVMTDVFRQVHPSVVKLSNGFKQKRTVPMDSSKKVDWKRFKTYMMALRCSGDPRPSSPRL